LSIYINRKILTKSLNSQNSKAICWLAGWLAEWLAGWLTEYTLLSNKYTHKQANRPQFKNYFFLSSRRNKDPGDTGGDAVVTIVSNSRVQNLRERRWHKGMH